MLVIIKIVSIIILFCACVLIGCSESSKLQSKVDCSEEIINLVNECLMYVKHEKMSTKSIMKSLNGNIKNYLNVDCLNKLIFDMKIDYSDNLNSRQILIVNNCFYKLKTCCREEIIECFEDSVEELRMLKKDVEDQYKNKLILYKKMGIVAGLFLSIILI